jgi:DNA polymerase-3 subunit alpha
MILLAASQVGWQNLLKLSSRSFLEGFYYKPRIDRELLAQFSEGLVCTTACLGGEVPSAFLCNQPDRARKIAGEYLDIFGKDRFFIEVQNQGLADQNAANPHLVKLAGELGVRIVGTNDVHFLRRQDKSAHEVLTCISTGKTLAEGGALEYPPEIYLKDMAEMRAALADLPGAADNTLAIAEMCDLKLHFKKHLPVFDIPNGLTAKEHLTRIGFEALSKRFGGSPPEEYRARLAREIDVIDGKGYCGYLLIVHDFVQFAKRNGIPIGARGSGCATLLGYVLDIVCCDPIRYGLLFERWTDPQRTEDPDFDIDICQEGRGKVIQYVREKYGHVAQIITYGTLKPKAVIRDVGRVMDIPLIEVDAIAKKVPDELKMTLDKAL